MGTSSMSASLPLLASAALALSATQQPVSMAPRTARLTASLAGASLAASPALSQLRRPLQHALASRPLQPSLVRRSLFEVMSPNELAQAGSSTGFFARSHLYVFSFREARLRLDAHPECRTRASFP